MKPGVRHSTPGYLEQLNNESDAVKKVLVLPGDNIGPEIVTEAVKVLEKVSQQYNLNVELDYAHLGGAALDAVGEPCPRRRWTRRGSPMPFCWVLWAAPSGTMWNAICARRKAC